MPKAKKTSNDLLEAVALAVICIASHANGLLNCKVFDFLVELFRQLTDLQTEVKIDNALMSQKFLDEIVPFLLVPNAEWPEGVFPNEFKHACAFVACQG
jgi:hypothetical protein